MTVLSAFVCLGILAQLRHKPVSTASEVLLLLKPVAKHEMKGHTEINTVCLHRGFSCYFPNDILLRCEAQGTEAAHTHTGPSTLSTHLGLPFPAADFTLPGIYPSHSVHSWEARSCRPRHLIKTQGPVRDTLEKRPGLCD